MVLWIYLCIKAYQQRKSLPWGFGIVIFGVLLSGYGIDINNSSTVFSINFLFVLILIGIFWNIDGARQLLQIRNMRDFLYFMIVGMIIGLILGVFLLLSGGGRFIQIDERFSLIGLIVLSLQVSTAEEYLFRGFLLGYLSKSGLNSAFGNVFQAVLFTAMHISRFSGNWISIFIIFLAAFVAGYFTLKYKNLVTAILMHNTVNMVAVVWWFITQS
jgi:membrane protease YdiL (CAAX protease family)